MQAHELHLELVHHPPHYRQGSIECIDAIHAALGDEGFIAYCQGNALKYLWRWRYKGGRTDIEKAIWYLERMFIILSSQQETQADTNQENG